MVFTAYSKSMTAFIYGFKYFAVVGNENKGFHLEENSKETPKRHPLNPTKPDTTTVVSHKAIHQINKSTTNRKPLYDGETYEFYAVVTPRIGGPKYSLEEVDKLTIDVFNDGSESGYYLNNNIDRYTITIDNFNRKIEPGKRYWFKLTATDEAMKVETDEYDDNDIATGKKEIDAYKLMFTSEREKKQKEKENNSGNTSLNQ